MTSVPKTHLMKLMLEKQHSVYNTPKNQHSGYGLIICKSI